jgi:hypothetical protein
MHLLEGVELRLTLLKSMDRLWTAVLCTGTVEMSSGRRR